MKKMKLEVMILGVAIAVAAYAQEAPTDERQSAERGRQAGGFYGEAGYLLPVGESYGRK